MEKKNLKLSEETVCAILQVLAERGFSKGMFSFDNLRAVRVDQECEQFFDMSVRWLMNEGIISVSKFQEYVGGEPIDAIRSLLTAKGLNLIGKRLETVKGQIVLKDFEEATSGSSQGYQHAGNFLGSLFGAAVKSGG